MSQGSARGDEWCDVRLLAVSSRKKRRTIMACCSFPCGRSLVEQVLDHLERDAGLVTVEQRHVGVGLVPNRMRAQLVEGLRGDAGELAHVVELVEQPAFFRLRRDRRIPPARCAGTSRRRRCRRRWRNITAPRGTAFNFLGKVGVGEFLARALDFGELRRQLDARRAVAAHGEAQKNRRVAVVAEIHDTHLLGLVNREVFEARHRDGCDVRHHLTMRTGHGEVLGLVVIQTAGESM